MGLKLEKTIKGIVCEYWIIKNTTFRKDVEKTIVSLALYYNEAARVLKIGNDLYNESFQFDGLDYSREELYNLIKQEEAFSNAEDC